MASGLSESLPAPIIPKSTALRRDGWLFKRQRLRASGVKRPQFQKRYVRLDEELLKYYYKPNDKNSRREFEVSSIKFVEEVEPGTFTNKEGLHYFQIGNQEEVMYFGTEKSQTKFEWMKALRDVIRISGNKMLSHYHPGAYGNNAWTCCKKAAKDISSGCHESQQFESAEIHSQEVEKRKRAPSLPDALASKQEPKATNEEHRDCEYDQMVPKNLLKGGLLHKRQRGKSVKGPDYSRLKFQPRLINLDIENLSYYDKDKPKVCKGLFEVSSIGFVEKVQPPSWSTFPKEHFYFQIGNENDIMYFGADTNSIRSDWIEALRSAATLRNDHYHPGVFGNGEWTCCETTAKDGTGCCKTTLENASVGESSTVAVLYPVNLESELNHQQPASYDTVSIASGSKDSGCESTSPSPSTSVTGTPDHERKKKRNRKQESVDSMDSLDIQGSGSNCDLLQEQQRHTYKDLLFSCQYESALTALDFGGTRTLIAAEKSGKVHVIDVYGNGSGKQNNRSQEYDKMHSEVKSVETWKNLFLISPKIGSWCLRDLDNREIDYSVPTQIESELHFVAFTPDGSKIITASEEGLIEALAVDSIQSDSISTASLNSFRLPGNPLLLSVSPDPKLPKIVACIARNERIVLCVCDYTRLESNDVIEIDIGDYQQSQNIKADFSFDSSITIYRKLAIGHGKILTVVKLNKTDTKPVLVFSTVIREVITSLKYSPIGDDLMIGLSNGDVDVLDGRANEHSFQQTVNFSLMATTSISFSKDCSLLALGQSNGKLSVIKRLRSTTIKSSKIISVQSSGDTLRLNEDDITVVFPDGFISQSSSMSFDYDVMIPELFGPECFQDHPGVRPVSAIFKLHPHNNIEYFEKPLEITMPHFADLKADEVSRRLDVFKACSGDYTLMDRKKIRDFKKIPRDETNISLSTVRQLVSDDTEKTIRYATFYPKHCCFYCIGMYQSEQTDNATFCLTRALKLTNDCPGALIHYCLYYDLPTCAKMVKEQYPENSYSLKSFDIKFSSDPDISDIGIKVLDIETLKENGWEYSLENCGESSKICAKNFNFWVIPSSEHLRDMCEKMSYPPRYILKVFAAPNAPSGKSTFLRVEFPGAVYTWFKDDSIILTVQLDSFSFRTTSSVSTVTIASEDNLPQPQGYEISAVQSAFRFISESEELPQPYSFALELNSNLLLKNCQMDSLFPNEDKIEEYQKSMKNYKILRAVQDNILEDPQKFNKLCTVLKNLECTKCLLKLKGGKIRHKVSESEINEDPHTPRESFSNGHREKCSQAKMPMLFNGNAGSD